jgi:hypothetical protein
MLQLLKFVHLQQETVLFLYFSFVFIVDSCVAMEQIMPTPNDISRLYLSQKQTYDEKRCKVS